MTELRSCFGMSIFGDRKLSIIWWLVTLVVGISSLLSAQTQAVAFQYFYDDLGQLTKVIDSTGTVIEYIYDPVGNILQIKRSSIAPGTLTLFNFTPQRGGSGQTVTIQGQAFDPTPANDVVQFNGPAAPVLSATATTLTVTVPAAATTGPISVTVAGQTVTSTINFTVLPVPIITALSRKSALLGASFPNSQFPALTVTGTNFTSDTTFALAPATSPPAAIFGPPVVDPTGTSATMSLTVGTTTTGTFALVARNLVGSSSTVATKANRFTIVDPRSLADTDGDGVPDAIEAIFGTDPLDPNSVPNPNLSPSGEADATFSVFNTAGASAGQPVSMEADALNFSVLNLAGVTGGQPIRVETDAKSFSVLNTAGAPGGGSGGTVPFEADALSFSVLNLAGVSSNQPIQMEVDGVPFSVENSSAPTQQQQLNVPTPRKPSALQKKSNSSSPSSSSSGASPEFVGANTNSFARQTNMRHRKPEL